MALEIRPVPDDELTAYREAMMTAFGDDLDVDPGGADRIRQLIGPGQRWAALDGGAIVATAATFDHAIVVPGGAHLPMAGLTMVAVRPTHRRRGILRRLMDVHFADARARGFGVSGLWASESSIYGRFGYGIAAEGDVVEIRQAHALQLAAPAAAEPLDAVAPIDEAEARRELPALYARAVAHRPGALVRSEAWWRERRFLEAPFVRGSASRRRHVLARRDGAPTGYLVYRQRSGFTDGLPSGRVEINELLAIDARAEASLWQLALRMDLFPTVAWWNAPPDDLLPWLVAEPRRVRRHRVDTLWLRIDDLPSALTTRRYATDGTLRLSVEGTALTLAVSDGCAHTAPLPAGSAVDLDLSRPALGSLFLGGFPATRLARAGHLRGSASALATADRLFGWPVAPWCPEVF